MVLQSIPVASIISKMDEKIKEIFTNALQRCSPAAAIERTVAVGNGKVQVDGKSWKVDKGQEVYIIGVGKASFQMVETLNEQLQDYKPQKLCIAPSFEGNTLPDYGVIASHPVPDTRSEEAAEKLIAFIQEIPAGALVFFALSGGASSLVCKPAGGISLEDMAQTHEMLLQSGAAIDEMNCVRKHLSVLKGGQLLTYFDPRNTLIDLVISDVPNDNLEIIGSGLTTPDSSTFQDSYHLLLQYDLWEKIPTAVHSYIEKGLTGEVSETIKKGEDPLSDHHAVIISSAQKLADEISEEAKHNGYRPWVAEKAFDQRVEEVVSSIVGKIKQLQEEREKLDKPAIFIFYGESTVHVTGDGKGGRNQQMALLAATEIAGWEGISWLSAGTDGIDGPTDAAGAIVDEHTIQLAEDRGVDAAAFLRNHDSYHFHQKMDTLLVTGPTGNNLMDVVLVTCKR